MSAFPSPLWPCISGHCERASSSAQSLSFDLAGRRNTKIRRRRLGSRAPAGRDRHRAERREILERFPHGEAELTLAERGGENLAAALRGEIDPVQILFPDGSFEIADKLYRESPSAKVFNGLARESIKTALARLPKDRTLRVLEIGAGTGGTSSYVLPEFPPERTEYISPTCRRSFSPKRRSVSSHIRLSAIGL